ncbi:hypothetical protein [Streptomyces sp. NPDC102360]|uniref:hypothetical protein n=1 Tax=Streptomyces sp. NPDC102360 TaxID=3366160 RepID=UPI0038299AF4
MPQPVSAAIVGTGFMGTVHARAVAAASGQVRLVAGSSADRAGLVATVPCVHLFYRATSSPAADRSTGFASSTASTKPGSPAPSPSSTRPPLWGGTPAKVCQGLTIAHRTLRPLVTG